MFLGAAPLIAAPLPEETSATELTATVSEQALITIPTLSTPLTSDQTDSKTGLSLPSTVAALDKTASLRIYITGYKTGATSADPSPDQNGAGEQHPSLMTWKVEYIGL